MGICMPNSTLAWYLHKACKEVESDLLLTLVENLPKTEEPLSEADTKILAERIESLPFILQTSLIAYYSFRLSDKAIEESFDFDNAYQSRIYAQYLLGLGFELNDGTSIHRKSFAAACDIASKKMKDNIAERVKSLPPHQFSAKHKRAMQRLFHPTRSKTLDISRRFLKRAAVVFLSIIVTGTFVLTASASLRERFFTWVISVYEKYTDFGADAASPDISLSFEELTQTLASYAPFYLPEGFEMASENANEAYCNRQYFKGEGEYINCKITLAQGELYLDTEGAIVSTIAINNKEAFIWHNKEISFVTFTVNDLRCVITSTLDMEETIKIAKSVKKV